MVKHRREDAPRRALRSRWMPPPGARNMGTRVREKSQPPASYMAALVRPQQATLVEDEHTI